MKFACCDISFFRLLLLAVAISYCFQYMSAQPDLPQRTLTVNATQAIHFGTFCITGGSGGTVTVDYNGIRTSTGDIVLLARAPISQPAIFEIKLCQGRNVIITYNSSTTITGNTGGSLTFNIGPTEKGGYGAYFPTNSDCNYVNILRVGGTLQVPGGALPGSYSGTFDITFNQE
jgi:hypothetical protein